MHGMVPNLGWPLGGLSFSLCSIFVPAFPLDRNNSGLKILKIGASTGDRVYPLEVISSSSISPLLGIWTKESWESLISQVSRAF